IANATARRNATATPMACASSIVSTGNADDCGIHTSLAQVPACVSKSCTSQASTIFAISADLSGLVRAGFHQIDVTLQHEVAVLAEGERRRIDVVLARLVRRPVAEADTKRQLVA